MTTFFEGCLFTGLLMFLVIGFIGVVMVVVLIVQLLSKLLKKIKINKEHLINIKNWIITHKLVIYIVVMVILLVVGFFGTFYWSVPMVELKDIVK